jgi:hypothetical protein
MLYVSKFMAEAERPELAAEGNDLPVQAEIPKVKVLERWCSSSQKGVGKGFLTGDTAN